MNGIAVWLCMPSWLFALPCLYCTMECTCWALRGFWLWTRAPERGDGSALTEKGALRVLIMARHGIEIFPGERGSRLSFVGCWAADGAPARFYSVWKRVVTSWDWTRWTIWQKLFEIKYLQCFEVLDLPQFFVFKFPCLYSYFPFAHSLSLTVHTY